MFESYFNLLSFDMERSDFLVIGGGVAGLTFALEAAKHGTVTILFKKDLEQSSTSWAQVGIAAVTEPDDDFGLHIEDTLIAGAGLCDRNIVEIVVTEGPVRVQELINLGAQFDKVGTSYHLHREGGHSRRRIFHTGDGTGMTIQQTLLAAAKSSPNIQFLTDALAIDLITSKKVSGSSSTGEVFGAYVYHKGRIIPYVAKKVLVATGGAGKVYLYTSNPDVATGDGIAMCYRAGVSVANMELFQFHPTCLYHPAAKSFLITEAMRGEGGKLRRINGELFMHKYHKDEELAPRDIVARAIDHEMKLHGEDHVLLDMTHKSKDFLMEHFPNIYARCLEFGFDLSITPLPVVPAAHYCCGGVVTNERGETTLKNLYVAGEAAWTGLHGANRLASNSLLEGLVFGYRAAHSAIKTLSETTLPTSVPGWDSGTAVNSDEAVVISQNWDEIRRFMWNYVGIVRSDKRLLRAKARSLMILKEIEDYYWNFIVTPDLIELRNLGLIAFLVIECALQRKESRGLHYTIDYPNVSENAPRNSVVTLPNF